MSRNAVKLTSFLAAHGPARCERSRGVGLRFHSLASSSGRPLQPQVDVNGANEAMKNSRVRRESCERRDVRTPPARLDHPWPTSPFGSQGGPTRREDHRFRCECARPTRKRWRCTLNVVISALLSASTARIARRSPNLKTRMRSLADFLILRNRRGPTWPVPRCLQRRRVTVPECRVFFCVALPLDRDGARTRSIRDFWIGGQNSEERKSPRGRTFRVCSSL